MNEFYGQIKRSDGYGRKEPLANPSYLLIFKADYWKTLLIPQPKPIAHPDQEEPRDQ